MTAYTLCQLDDIPANSARGFALDDQQREATVFVVRQGEAIYVCANVCPHLGLPLEWMPDQFLDSDGHYIQCATHGALFRIRDGYCVSGPCPGELLRALPFRIEGKSIIIDSPVPET